MDETNKERKPKVKGEQFQYSAVIRDNLEENFIIQSPILRKYIEEEIELTPAEAEPLMFEEDYKIQNCFYCPYCGDRLKLVAQYSKQVNMHFRHMSTSPRGEKDHPPRKSQWHEESQNQFEAFENVEIEGYLKVSDEDRSRFPFLKNRSRFFADIQILSHNGKRIIIEYQKSYISTEAFTRRTEFYSKYADIFIWVFDGYVRNIIEAPMLAALSQLHNVVLLVDNCGNTDKDIFNPEMPLYWIPKNLNTRICHDIKSAIVNYGIPISKDIFVNQVVEGVINDLPKEFYLQNRTVKELYDTILKWDSLYGKVHCFGANRRGANPKNRVKFYMYDMEAGRYNIAHTGRVKELIRQSDEPLWDIQYIKTENEFIQKQGEGFEFDRSFSRSA